MPKATDIPAATRKAVHERDGQRCRWCGQTNAGVEIHHIEYRSAARNNHALDNLISLCGRHHRMVHSDKGKYPPILVRLLASPGLTGIQVSRQLERETRVQTDVRS